MIKKLLLFTLVALALPSALVSAAEYAEPALVPLSPSIMAQGGAAVATAHGYDSFFYNPAGFSRGKRELVIPGATAWMYSRPDELLAFGLGAITAAPTPTDFLNLVGSQVTGGGFGVGASVGIGYVGDGLGLGVVLMVDSLLRGPTLLGLTGDVTGTLGFIGGFSAPVALGKAKLHLGVDVRPMLRFHVPLANAEAIALVTALASGGSILAAVGTSNALYGVGIGLDAGAIFEWGPLLVGLSLRDIGGTRFQYSSETLSSIQATLGSAGRLPVGSAVADTYATAMDLAAGIAFHPNLGKVSRFFDPSLQVDCQDIISIIRDGDTAWKLLHAGAEIRLGGLLLRARGARPGLPDLRGGAEALLPRPEPRRVHARAGRPPGRHPQRRRDRGPRAQVLRHGRACTSIDTLTSMRVDFHARKPVQPAGAASSAGRATAF